MTPRGVALLVPDITARRGMERATTNLANALAGAGWPVRLISVFSNGAPAAYPLTPDVELLHLGLQREVSNNVQRLVKLAHTLRHLAKPTQTAEVIIAAEGMLAVNAAILKMQRPWQQVIAWEHLLSELDPPLYRRLRRAFYPMLDAVVVLNEHERLAFASWGLKHVVRIPNVTSFPEVQVADYDQPRAISVGAHTADRVKGFDRLIPEAAPVLRTQPQWKIVIVGRDVPGPELEQLATAHGVAEQVERLAAVSDISAQYRRASFMVMASRHEALPMVILEAKAHGLATLAYDVPHGPREMITDGVDGFLVPDGDSVTFARRFEQLVTGEALRRQLGEAAAQSAAQYSPQAIAEQWRPLLQRSRARTTQRRPGNV
ncbi:glycosyltransferase [Deinococcus arcticus]|uniref:Glycosyltransferase family 4 protein n=1 Tax=Deinococcus arcticus TaxID=2136176 RepID=A0A2T3W5F9_9DEIO|nr:glycosyltransferase [Deinococcus arcticus]PTA67130.1 hypothetical protein C8263_14550 [Deinococcus arcticus]